jgi:hypothetical protein
MTDELRIAKDLEGSGRSLIEVIYLNSLGRTEEHNDKPRSR